MDIDAQLKLNAVRDQRAKAYAQECANRPKPQPIEFGTGYAWNATDAAGLQNID